MPFVVVGVGCDRDGQGLRRKQVSTSARKTGWLALTERVIQQDVQHIAGVVDENL